LAYKPGLPDVVDRHRRLWAREMPDAILAAIFPAELPYIDPLGVCPDIQSMAEAWDHNYRVRQQVQDDLLPVARVSFGSAAFGAYLGAPVTFHGWGGWSKPILESYDQIESLLFDTEAEWIQRQEKACRHFVERGRGKFGVCETEPIDALNLAELLRGSRVYSDLYDRPFELHRLLDFACDFNIRFIEFQREILRPCLFYQEGIFSLFRIWLPGQAVWISVDAYGNCSPRIFREFGATYIQSTMD